MSPEQMSSRNDYEKLPNRIDESDRNKVGKLPNRNTDVGNNEAQLLPDRTHREISVERSIEDKAERILAELRDYIFDSAADLSSLVETMVVSTCLTKLEQLAQTLNPKSLEKFINGIEPFQNKKGDTFVIDFYTDKGTRLLLKQITESHRNTPKKEKREDPREKNTNAKKERIEAKITSVSEAKEEIQKRFLVISSVVRSGQDINSDQIQMLLEPSVNAVWHIYQNFAWHQDIIDLFYKTRFKNDKGEEYGLMNVGKNCKLSKRIKID